MIRKTVLAIAGLLVIASVVMAPTRTALYEGDRSTYSVFDATRRLAVGYPGLRTHIAEWADAESRIDTLVTEFQYSGYTVRKWKATGPRFPSQYDEPILIKWRDAMGHLDSLWFPDAITKNSASGFPTGYATDWFPVVIDTFFFVGTDSFSSFQFLMVVD